MPDAGPLFVPNRRDVAHEGFEGEVILIHFPSGKYFRLDDAGKVAWSAVEAGATADDVAAALRRSFEVEEARAQASARTFLGEIAGHGLAVEGARPPPAPAPVAPAAPAARRPFSEPKVEVFSDLQELFLVDPIHDVDDSGWPHVRP